MNQHLSIADKIGSFKLVMDVGALYWEFSDGLRIALHKDVYESSYVDKNGDTVFGKKEFINRLICQDRKIVKVFYKSYNMDDLDTTGQWVDLTKVYSRGILKDVYRRAYALRNSISIDVKNIKSVEYTDTELKLHTIEEFDGVYTPGVQHVHFPTKGNFAVMVKQYSITQPNMVNNNHMKNDLHVEVPRAYKHDLKNTLVWLNGAFVKHDIINHDNNKEAVIKNGKSYLGTHVVDYSGNEPHKFAGGTRFATLDPDEDREVRRYDFDIDIIKWDGVVFSDWLSPILTNYESYLYDYKAGNIVLDIDYPTKLSFDTPVNANAHILLLDGIVVDREKYDVVDNYVILKSVDRVVKNNIRAILTARGPRLVKGLGHRIESTIAKGGRYNLINLSHEDDTKTITLNRSSNCLTNYPYPYYVTFPKFKLGDIVLLDGIFERYLAHSTNSIRYHYTDYMARYSDKNILSDTKVERLWISIDE